MGIKKLQNIGGGGGVYELWIADGSVYLYACKRILFKAGNRTSLQVHAYKIETNYVLTGIGVLLRSKEPQILHSIPKMA